MAWHGDEAKLQQLCQIFEAASSPDTRVQQQVMQTLGQFGQLPDFNMYLVAIFGQMPHLQEVVRQRAGLLLKTHVMGLSAAGLAPGVADHINSNALSAMQDKSRTIRNTAGTILTTMVQKVGISACGTALEKLVESVGGSSHEVVEGSLSALGKICEDGLALLERASAGSTKVSTADAQLFVTWTSQQVLPKVVSCASPSVPAFARQSALECLNHFALTGAFNDGKYPALEQFRAKYIDALGTLANDTTPEVLQAVCKGFACSMDNDWSCMTQQHYQVILQFMLKASQNPEYGVRLEALAVWKACAAKPDSWAIVGKMLPDLVPTLLTNMIYADADFMILDQSHLEDDNAGSADSLDDIAPRFHKESKNIDGDGDDEEDGPPVREAHSSHAWGAEWTARKAAAASLDALSEIFQADMLPLLLPLVQEKLAHASWEHQEAGVLALGAIGVNCLKRLEQFLPQVIQLLLGLCDSPKPLLRSIACWCVSRFSAWICWAQNPNQAQIIGTVTKTLLTRCLDRNKHVQSAAMSALMAVLETGGAVLIPHLNDVVETLVKALQLYQIKNTRLLYDTIGLLAWIGPDLDKPQYVQALLSPLVQRFDTVPDADVTTLSLFECLTSVSQCLGKSAAAMVPKLVMRCLKIVNETAMAIKVWEQNPNEYERPDKELMATAVDLLAGIVEGLKEQAKEMVAKMNFLSILPLVCQDKSSRTRQSGFWLWGTATAFCIEQLAPLLPQLLPMGVAGLAPGASITVNNNATWAMSETALKVPADLINPHLNAIVPALLAILQRKDGVDVKAWQRQGHRQLMTTVCVTLQHLKASTALGSQWPSVYNQLPAELRTHLQQMCGFN
ncbi:unnamed protein product [Polarella glacialis]|uniref:Importin N-terminal domain-containing protein n=1 Tax=Polarella glacialis TaxID=89957 RepID=A0A813FRY2_POLGL|nr:unnamed protein product [Polarella glacialis]